MNAPLGMLLVDLWYVCSVGGDEFWTSGTRKLYKIQNLNEKSVDVAEVQAEGSAEFK